MQPSLLNYRYSLIGAALALLALGSMPALAEEMDGRQKASRAFWDEHLKPANFGDAEIIEGAGQDVLEIKAPFRAEDPTVVPLSIHSKIPQTAEHYIKKISVFIDKNPLPLVGTFEFTPRSGKADLAMRIRVDDFSYIRAIAETNDGKLYMADSYIRSLGGCSAPPGESINESIARLGEMRVSTIGDLEPGKPSLAQVQIKHPNITGLALDQRTRVRPPAYFVNKVRVSYEGEPVVTANLTFAISQDPSFRFFFVPEKGDGELTVEAVDTKELAFTETEIVTL
ncbi:MAG: quinoprotein dehydrogenase-associated SoxYZ-like carrier [Gammaproteobacteria bacterium]